jgi:hypothetical protein
VTRKPGGDPASLLAGRESVARSHEPALLAVLHVSARNTRKLGVAEHWYDVKRGCERPLYGRLTPNTEVEAEVEMGSWRRATRSDENRAVG